MRRVSEREPAIRQVVIVKKKLMSVFNAAVLGSWSVLLLIMNFVITLSKQLWIHEAYNVMTKFMINNRTEA